jgi:hypothetical protein
LLAQEVFPLTLVWLITCGLEGHLVLAEQNSILSTADDIQAVEKLRDEVLREDSME